MQKARPSPGVTKTDTQRLMELGVADYIKACDPINVSKNADRVPEFEVRFGTTSSNRHKPYTKVDYDSVVREIGKHGYRPNDVRGTMLLRISPEIAGKRANVRAEIVGSTMISAYCRTNSIEKVLATVPDANKVVKFTRKTDPERKIGPLVNGEATSFISFEDYNFRMAFQMEQNYSPGSSDPDVRAILDGWAQSRKHFRCMNRTRFQSSDPTHVVAVDLSIIKSNVLQKGKAVPAVTTSDAGVFGNAPETYEIELELDNHRVVSLISSRQYSQTELVHMIVRQLRSAIRVVLSGLQETMYPVPYSEQNAILREYMSCLHGDDWDVMKTDDMKAARLSPYFVGPSPVTLQLSHVVEPRVGGAGGEGSAWAKRAGSQANILADYCVTEKADGVRSLLYVSVTGRVYFINSNLKVIFTGAETKDKDCFRIILDGEYIERNTKSAFLNLYAAFDVYYVHSMHPYSAKVNIQSFPFCKARYEADEGHKYRLPILEKIISMLKLSTAGSAAGSNCLLTVRAKQFFVGAEKVTATNPNGTDPNGTDPNKTDPNGTDAENEKEGEGEDSKSIFVQSGKIWNQRHAFDYEIDGLIFTPTNLGVGRVPGEEAVTGRKYTWNLAFKWKPSNTIDFLVQTVKDKTGHEKIFNRFEGGKIVQYKQIVLHCGYNVRTDNFAHPVHDMLHDKVSQKGSSRSVVVDESAVSSLVAAVQAASGARGYYPVPFVPSTPYDNMAKYCNVAIDSTDKLMRAADGDVFTENMIVEFDYIRSTASGPREEGHDSAWNWVPIKVRYDKTGKLRAGGAEFGNPYFVANDNWKATHFPVTEDIIRGMSGVSVAEEELYYNGADKVSHTNALRTFHNAHVKRVLIERIASAFGPAVGANKGVNISGKQTGMGPKVTLIDFAVGKAGDLFKWRDARVQFVLGIDLFKDNIMNAKDGAVARYQTMREKSSYAPLRAIFLHGDSSLNIRTEGTAFYTDQDRQVARAIFGEGSDDRTRNQVAPPFYRIGADGFRIGSCQFAQHYFFESPRKLHAQMRNLAECIAKGGYYIGTCYDGAKVFAMLKDKRRGESVTLYADPEAKKHKVFEVVKKYSADVLPDDETSVGMKISVFQESINNTIDEYLVNFVYFDKIMADYGFELIDEIECAALGFKSGRGSFRLLHSEMTASSFPSVPSSSVPVLSDAEKQISFLNEYFVYKKVRTVDAATIKALSKAHADGSADTFGDRSSSRLARDTYVNYARRIPNKYVVASSKNLYT